MVRILDYDTMPGASAAPFYVLHCKLYMRFAFFNPADILIINS